MGKVACIPALSLAAALLAAPVAPAQHLPVPPAGARTPLTYPMTRGDSSKRHIPQTYWFEGAVAGGAALGLLGASFSLSMCSHDSPCTHSFLVGLEGLVFGGLTGFGIGALIGGLFPKHEHDPPP